MVTMYNLSSSKDLQDSWTLRLSSSNLSRISVTVLTISVI
jgi:hypothetical protein